MLELQGQEKMQLILLKKEYNTALERYNKMCNWVLIASEEEQLKNYKHVVDVINNCNRLLSKVKQQDPLVTANEILNGFKL